MDSSDPQSISSPNHLFVPRVTPQPKGVAPSTKNPLPSTTDSSITDQVSVSEFGREHQAIQEVLKEVPEIRQERVNQIRTALESGTYEVPSDLLAERLIQDTFLNQLPSED